MTDYSELKRLVAQGSLPPIVSTLIAENEELRAHVDGGLAVIRAQRQQIDSYLKDAERYRWLRNQADAMDWKFLSHQGPETIDQNIDCAMTPSGNESAVMEISEEKSRAISKRGRDALVDSAETLSGAVRLKLELERLDAENDAIRKVPSSIANEYSVRATHARSMREAEKFQQRMNGAMEVDRRIKAVKA